MQFPQLQLADLIPALSRAPSSTKKRKLGGIDFMAGPENKISESPAVSAVTGDRTGDVTADTGVFENDEQEQTIPAVEFRDVSFSFEDEKVLDGLAFTVMSGELKIILSGSGGGKSTILKLILGLLKPDKGMVLI